MWWCGVGSGCKYYNVLFSPTAPEPVPHCSTTAVYNSSTDELTDIAVSWHQAEVSCIFINVCVQIHNVYTQVMRYLPTLYQWTCKIVARGEHE